MRALVNNTKRVSTENFLENIDQLCKDVKKTKAKIRLGDNSIMTRERLASYTSKLTDSQKKLLSNKMKEKEEKR